MLPSPEHLLELAEKNHELKRLWHLDRKEELLKLYFPAITAKLSQHLGVDSPLIHSIANDMEKIVEAIIDEVQ